LVFIINGEHFLRKAEMCQAQKEETKKVFFHGIDFIQK
jgi:hypothetical protein